jgi:hypothetical protein
LIKKKKKKKELSVERDALSQFENFSSRWCAAAPEFPIAASFFIAHLCGSL